MKKFQFTLAKLLSYKEQVLQKEKNDLAELRRQQMVMADEKQEIIALCSTKNDEFISKSKNGLTMLEIAMQKTFINSLHESIHLKQSEIEKMEVRIQKQLEIVIEATKEISSIEKLKEKQLDEYKKKDQKEQELFIEEFVSNASFYKKD